MPGAVRETLHTGRTIIPMRPVCSVNSGSQRLTQLAKPRRVCESLAPLDIVLIAEQANQNRPDLDRMKMRHACDLEPSIDRIQVLTIAPKDTEFASTAAKSSIGAKILACGQIDMCLHNRSVGGRTSH